MTADNVLTFTHLSEQKAKEILQEVTQSSFNVKFSKHALERMEERGITRPQVTRVLTRGNFSESPHRSVNGNWKMTLVGIAAGSEIEVACALDYNETLGNYTVIITTYIY